MKNRHYTYILYFISLVISATLAIQLYWNYKNYQAGKQQLTNEIQASFNNAIDTYYIEMSKKNTIGFFSKNEDGIFEHFRLDSALKKMDFTGNAMTVLELDSIDPETISTISILRGSKAIEQQQAISISEKHSADSLNEEQILVSSIIFSTQVDTLERQVLNTYIEEQLAAKNIDVNYGYVFENAGKTQKYHPKIMETADLSTVATSGYLPDGSSFKIYFGNAMATILKRNLIGILLSVLLVGGVVFCLFFLLKIINRQKQLSELKNDLISNITHEFKTPISTIGVALEGIQHFNKENDPKKTNDYLETSNEQLVKLNLMVEKLLETATLDGGDLQLNKEEIQLNQMLQNLVTKYQTLHPNKHFDLKIDEKPVKIIGDTFHLENAFNNLLDNAVKYGGNEIKISANTYNNLLEINFRDNGKTLSKEQSAQVFDKFYRVPKGNTHDVKGFGIGLYYTKQIIEKHGGTIFIKLNGSTNFIVNLPYG